MSYFRNFRPCAGRALSGVYIYIYIGNHWALPQRCSIEGSHSESNVVATLHSIGKINKSIREYYNWTPVKLYIPLGRSTKVLYREYLNPTPVKFTFNWEDQRRY